MNKDIRSFEPGGGGHTETSKMKSESAIYHNKEKASTMEE